MWTDACIKSDAGGSSNVGIGNNFAVSCSCCHRIFFLRVFDLMPFCFFPLVYSTTEEWQWLWSLCAPGKEILLVFLSPCLAPHIYTEWIKCWRFSGEIESCVERESRCRPQNTLALPWLLRSSSFCIPRCCRWRNCLLRPRMDSGVFSFSGVMDKVHKRLTWICLYDRL